MAYNYFGYNNPGNIGYSSWTAAQGGSRGLATDTGHNIATFPDLNSGYTAMANLAINKYNAGATSLNDLIAGPGGWTPGNYGAAASIAQTMGISPSADLNLSDPGSMSSFQRALTLQETGSTQQFDQYQAGGGAPLYSATDNSNSLITGAGDASNVGNQNDALQHTTLGDSSGALGPSDYPALNPKTPMTNDSSQFNQPDPSKLEVTDIASSGLVGQKQVASATTGAGQSVQTGLNTAGQDVLTSEANAQSGLGDLFARGSLVGIALVILAGAGVFYYMQRKDSTLSVKAAA